MGMEVCISTRTHWVQWGEWGNSTIENLNESDGEPSNGMWLQYVGIYLDK